MQPNEVKFLILFVDPQHQVVFIAAPRRSQSFRATVVKCKNNVPQARGGEDILVITKGFQSFTISMCKTQQGLQISAKIYAATVSLAHIDN